VGAKYLTLVGSIGTPLMSGVPGSSKNVPRGIFGEAPIGVKNLRNTAASKTKQEAV